MQHCCNKQVLLQQIKINSITYENKIDFISPMWISHFIQFL